MKSQWDLNVYFPQNKQEAFCLVLEGMGTHKIKTLRDLVTKERLGQNLPFTQQEADLATWSINNLMQQEQAHTKTDDQSIKRVKIISDQLSKLCLEAIRNRHARIDSITANCDRVAKLVMLLGIFDHSKSSEPIKPLQFITADFRSLESLNRLLQDRLLNLNLKAIEKAEKFQTSYFAVFENDDFLDYIDRVSFIDTLGARDGLKFPYNKQLTCIHKSLKKLDHFRVHNELAYKDEPKKRNEIYAQIIDGFKIHEKELKQINKTLEKLARPAYAEFKELIINNNFAINAKIGADILLSDKRDHVLGQIKKMEKRLSQRKTRKADSQTQKNITVYNFFETELNPCDFIEHKTRTINKLVNDFIINKTAAKIIASRKDFEHTESTRQVTIRMPKATYTAIERLAKRNNISHKLLLNIIIQDSAEVIKSAGQIYYNKTLLKKGGSPNTHETLPLDTEQSTPSQDISHEPIKKPDFTGIQRWGRAAAPPKEESSAERKPWASAAVSQKNKQP